MTPHLQYLVGFFDGEGCITFCPSDRSHKNYSLRTCISNTHLPVLEIFQKAFGGTIATCHQGGNRKVSYVWHLHGTKAIGFIWQTREHTVTKIQQVKLALEYAGWRSKRTDRKLSEEDFLILHKFVVRLQAFNKRGKA